jgi:hypothetical protein
MARAIFVNLRNIYQQLAPAAHVDQQSTALRDCTCGWWRVNPESAGDIKFAFGIYEGRVVSAYKVQVPVAEWPVMPKRAVAQTRRYIPASDISAKDWTLAKTWAQLRGSSPRRLAPAASGWRPLAGRLGDGAAQSPPRFKSHSRGRASSSRPTAVLPNGLLSRPAAALCGSVVVVMVTRRDGRRRSRKKASVGRGVESPGRHPAVPLLACLGMSASSAQSHLAAPRHAIVDRRRPFDDPLDRGAQRDSLP